MNTVSLTLYCITRPGGNPEWVRLVGLTDGKNLYIKNMSTLPKSHDYFILKASYTTNISGNLKFKTDFSKTMKNNEVIRMDDKRLLKLTDKAIISKIDILFSKYITSLTNTDKK